MCYFNADLSQCLPSWIPFEGSCYKLFTDLKNQESSKQVCNDNGAHLVTIESADKQNFIYEEFLAGAGSKDYWIGLTDSETEGNWKWANGATLTGYNNWASYQPNDYKGQDCAAIKGATQNSGKWHDVSCYFNKGFICELI